MPFKVSSSYGNRRAGRIICRYSPASLTARGLLRACGYRPASLPRDVFAPCAVHFSSGPFVKKTCGRETYLHCRHRGPSRPNPVDGSPITGRAVFLQTRKYQVSAVIEHLEGEARERLILWLKRRMEECDITLEALQHALQQDIDAVRSIRYRDASGNTWTGEGDQPEWLRRAVAAGQSIDHFLCA
nr:H-NS family nucleoid-associated regulatory protein [Paraburkholderia sabiae]